MKFPGKKIAISLLVASLSTPAMAAMYQAPSSNDMFYEAGVLYGGVNDKTLSEFAYADTSDAAAGEDGNFVTNSASMKEKFGFTLSIGRWLTPNQNSMVMTFSHLGNDDTHSASGTNLVPLLSQLVKNDDLDGIAGFTIGDENSNQLANGSATYEHKFKYNEFDVTYFNKLKSSYVQRATIRNFYGLRFVHFKKSFDATYTGTGEIAGDDGGTGVRENLAVNDTMSFSQTSYGVMPRMGIASDWQVTDHFSIGADLAAGLVIGTHSGDFNETFTGTNANGDNPTRTYSTTMDSSVWATVETDANIRAKLFFPMKGDCSFELSGGIMAKRFMTDGSVVSVRRQDSVHPFSVKDNIVLRSWFLTARYMA